MSVISGIFQSEATESAADTSSQAAKDAAQVQLQMFREAQAAMEPWRASGANALNQLNALMGLPSVPLPATRSLAPTSARVGTPPVAPVRPVLGNSVPEFFPWPDDTGNPARNPDYKGPGAAMEKYNQDYAEYVRRLAEYNAGGAVAPAPGTEGGQVRLPAMNLLTGERSRLPGGRGTAAPASQDWRSLMDPGYEFRKQEGINALMAAGAAAGNFGSGNMGVALQDYGQNIASQEFQNVYNRLAGLSGTGQVQSQQIGNLGISTAGNMGNFLNQAGQNIAQGQIAGSNALWGGVRDLSRGLGAYAMFGGGGGAPAMTQDWFDLLWS